MFRLQPSAEDIKLVELKNGKEVPEQAVITTHMALKAFMKENDIIAMYELLEICNNHEHKMFGNTQALAERHGLIVSGRVHDNTKAIILSALEKREDGFELVNPLKPSASPRP
jgi:hypothetical protein